MFSAVSIFVGLAAVIIAAGYVLARCADAIAEATGLGGLLVGSILLAGATSLPELSVDLSAVRMNMPDLAVGDLLGSSLMNLLILAVLDLSYYSRGKMLSRNAAAHALAGTFSIALTGVVGLALLTSSRVGNWVFLGVHAWIWIVAAGYVLGVRMVFLDQRISARTFEEQTAPVEKPPSTISPWKAGIGFVCAAAVILVTGPHLAKAAGHLAELSGLGNTFVGTTFVAVSTSLPELAASFVAIRLGAYDLAIGNVFGSNAFNMLLFLPLDFAFPGALFASTTPVHTVSAFAIIVATSIVLMGQLYHVESRRRFFEPDAIMVILIVLAAFGVIYCAG